MSVGKQHLTLDVAESEGKEKKDNEPSPEVPQATTEHPKGTCRLRDLFIEKIWFIYFAVLIVAMAYRFWQLEPMLPPEPILLRAGAKLYPGQWRSSATHHIRLGVDGNLLLSEGLYGAGGRVVWQSKTGQEGGKCRRCFARLKKGSRKENPAISKLEVWNGPKVLATFPLVDTFPLDMHIHQV